MKQDGLNNCLQMHCHKSITDTQDTVKIAKRFECANEQRTGHLRKMSPPTPPSRFKMLRRLCGLVLFKFY